jgi:hypothetical protein
MGKSCGALRKEKRKILRERICDLYKREDLKGTLGHQSNTLRGARACLSYRLGFLSMLW